MAAAVALSNYQLGDVLGRGASGSVYRALNFLTGETVAIKSISLLSLPPSSLPDIMSEIDLLKNLNHPNIVKYKGFARDKENLFIVLEYCENGSLQTILKKFGKFPESLVAVYVSQVLEGLIYLHEQGVIHRDIKGANILTNKDGSVKLADFGVSSRAPQPTLGSASTDRDDNEVVGSPYWMAPEVIEQSGASTASDIWSVGCVVVELLEGKPPHGDLAPMQALWRVVQDESMKIPDGASPIVKDFLYHCFQKDPNLRVSAKKLLRHPWMLSVRKAADTSIAIQPSTTYRRPSSRSSSVRVISRGSDLNHSSEEKHAPSSASSPSLSANANTAGDGAHVGGSGTVRPKRPMTVYDEAVQRVQEWNEALNASPKALGSLRRLPITHARKTSNIQSRSKGETSVTPVQALFTFPTRSSAEALAQSAAPLGSTAAAGQNGLLGKNIHVSDVLNRAKESEGSSESWDDDFASDITLSKLDNRRVEPAAVEEVNQKTLRPARTPSLSSKSLPSVPATARSVPNTPHSTRIRDAPSGQTEDYSDIGLGEGADSLESKLSKLKLKNHSRKGLYHPDDIRKVTIVPAAPIPVRSISTPAKPVQSASRPVLHVPASPRNGSQGRSPPSSRQSSLRGKGQSIPGGGDDNSLVEIELNKYSEKEDEDYEDVFHGTDSITVPSLHHTQSLQLTRRSNRSWASEGDEEDLDPFAEIEDDFDAESLEANLLRDKRATLCASVNKLVEGLLPTAASSSLRQACDELLSLLENSPAEMGLEAHFVSQHGLLAVLEMLESRLSRDIAVRLLKLVNLIVTTDVEMLESFCLIGGIPVIIPYTSKKHSLETRLAASAFVQELTRSPLTLQMFISCRGLRTLVELLDEDYALNKTLILSSLEGISSVFDLQSPTPRNDFCRMFVREGILDPLSTALLSILQDEDLREDPDAGQIDRAVTTLLLFCQVAQADRRVKEAFTSRTVMIRLLKACDLLPRKLLVTAIKAIKHLSTSPQLIEILQNSNAMQILVDLLGKCIKGAHANEICSQIFQTIYSMTRLSKTRQEEAAASGIIPLLKKVIQNKSPLKQFALPILCDLANAGKGSRRLLWKYEGLTMYLDLLQDPYWQVSALDAILAWMQDETARVEDVLLEKTASDSIVSCFVHASGVSFEGILDPFLKILRLSTALTASISHPPFYTRLADTLERSTKAVIKLNLLRLTRVVCDAHPDQASLVARFGLVDIVEKLSRQDTAVLVRELAKEILPGLLFGGDVPDPLALSRLRSSPDSVIDQPDDSLKRVPGVRSLGPESRATMHRAMSEGVVSSSLVGDSSPPPQSSREQDTDRFKLSNPARLSAGPRPVTSTPTARRSTAAIPGPSPQRDRTAHRAAAQTAHASSSASMATTARRETRSMPPPPVPALRRPATSPTVVDPIQSPDAEASSSSSTPKTEAGHSESEPSSSQGAVERPKHKRKISRSQLKEVMWQTDENGVLRSVRTPAKLAGYTVE
ncbi:hypothetical protein IAU60_003271 [Kwoniella sp. DSM 27419]